VSTGTTGVPVMRSRVLLAVLGDVFVLAVNRTTSVGPLPPGVRSSHVAFVEVVDGGNTFTDLYDLLRDWIEEERPGTRDRPGTGPRAALAPRPRHRPQRRVSAFAGVERGCGRGSTTGDRNDKSFAAGDTATMCLSFGFVGLQQRS
jgi:hypothetical protein